jgi:transcriptional regulator with XRE-family HTH domain
MDPMDIADVSRELHDTIRGARTAKGMTQETLAMALGVTQSRIAELETRLRDGRPTKQVSMLMQAAAAVGLVPMFVPVDAADEIKALIEHMQSPPPASVWDEAFLDLSGDDEVTPGFVPR